MKNGLILEGGAMRGLFTAGILDVFLEKGITFDGAIGVSAGAVFGCNFKSKQKRRTIRYNTRFAKNPRYCSVRSLIRTGDMFGEDFCYHVIPKKLDVFDQETFQKNPMEFYVVATDVETGEAVYVPCNNGDEKEIRWMQASASMPLAARIVEIDGRGYLDGGVADSVPVRAFEDMGYEHNVIILTQPKEYEKKKNKLMPVMKKMFSAYPNLIRAIENRHVVYNETLRYIEELERDGKALVIRPDGPLGIGHVEHDPDKLREVYMKGRRIGEQYAEQVQKFINEK